MWVTVACLAFWLTLFVVLHFDAWVCLLLVGIEWFAGLLVSFFGLGVCFMMVLGVCLLLLFRLSGGFVWVLGRLLRWFCLAWYVRAGLTSLVFCGLVSLLFSLL